MHIKITKLIERLQDCLEEYGDISVVLRVHGSKVDHWLDGPHYDEEGGGKIYFEHY